MSGISKDGIVRCVAAFLMADVCAVVPCLMPCPTLTGLGHLEYLITRYCRRSLLWSPWPRALRRLGVVGRSVAQHLQGWCRAVDAVQLVRTLVIRGDIFESLTYLRSPDGLPTKTMR